MIADGLSDTLGRPRRTVASGDSRSLIKVGIRHRPSAANASIMDPGSSAHNQPMPSSRDPPRLGRDGKMLLVEDSIPGSRRSQIGTHKGGH